MVKAARPSKSAQLAIFEVMRRQKSKITKAMVLDWLKDNAKRNENQCT